MSQAPVTPYRDNFKDTRPFSNYNLNVLLAADTALTWTIPGDSTQKYRVKFSCSYSVEIWVRYNGTATDPSSNTVTVNSYQELLPLNEFRYVNGGDTLSFISHTTPRLSATLLELEK